MRAIAMKCTQEQFESIKPKLEKVGFVIDYVRDGFYSFPWLVNNYMGDNGKIGNNDKADCKRMKREKLSYWDEKVFLEACGVEVEPKFKINKETVLKYQMKDEFPECFEKVNGYYKHKNNKHEKWFCYIDFVTGEYYGHNNSEWMSGNNNNMICYIEKHCITMTPQEVQQALEKEAVNRGYRDGMYVKPMWDTPQTSWSLIGNTFKFINGVLYLSSVIFKDGLWAEIIPQYTQQEAEEKFNFKTIAR